MNNLTRILTLSNESTIKAFALYNSLYYPNQDMQMLYTDEDILFKHLSNEFDLTPTELVVMAYNLYLESK